ncbi:MAG: NADH-quinone oxidoreductase subunit L [Elusimicrobia bacterium]|nr:NADH-quinone oxidoreductase subunit L [Candidatus Obscuribacterium magneticum]
MDLNQILQNAVWIPIAPLAAFALIFAFKKVLGVGAPWVGILALLYGFLHTLLLALGIYSGAVQFPSEGLQGRFFEATLTWFSVGNFDFRIGVLIDGLSSLMMVVVTLVSLCVQIYSVSYMKGHKRFGLYFAYINLFTFSMLLLVVANNLVQFFIGWELVGLCSYFLIGFDFEREQAAFAGRKAFITTKLADSGMYLGLLIVFNYLGTFDIPLLQQNISMVQHPAWVTNAIPLLLFVGAMGKSAQVPFHVWLPDAMEGPTPVSALIHAATMVAAGVYMVARLFFFFEASPISLEVIAWVGVMTALIGASMGLVASDIKRVLAFSTISQLGIMMAGLGCGGYKAAIFHLTTHAAFKALLFLCAGCVIHSLHTNDMWKMGGLLTKMPITSTTYFIGTVAVSGLPFTSGFFSKEEILSAAFLQNPLIFVLLVFSSFLTATYMFRSWFLTFTGLPRERDRYQHGHEAPPLMTFPLVILAVPSLALGGFLVYQGNLSKWLHWGPEISFHPAESVILLSSLMAFVLGVGVATYVYYFKPTKYEALAGRFKGPYQILVRQYGFDSFYLWVIRRFVNPFSEKLARFDYNVIDQTLVDGVGFVGRKISQMSHVFDGRVIDQVMVDGQGWFVRRLGYYLRRFQSGLAQNYLFWMAVGLLSMLVWMSQAFI